MTGLLYRPDWIEARERLTIWWNGGDIGRPAMQIQAPRAEPFEIIPAWPEPEGWVTRYSTRSMDYRIHLALRHSVATEYFAEAVPSVASGDVGAGCLSLFLGCRGVESPGTVWLEPCMSDPDTAVFSYDPDNFYWKFCLEAYQEAGRRGKGKFLQQFPDLIEGLDTLAGLRGTEELLIDLVERPEWVQASLRKITDLYFRYYDVVYDLIRDEVGGSVFWAWAPGRMSKFQCDFSAMISPGMFREFMLPVLTEMTERVSYSMYHWDGPGALVHLDALLEIPRLNMIQWTPGAGQPEPSNPVWWPTYHRVLEGGKKLFISVDTKEQLLAIKREFGQRAKGMLINMSVSSEAEARACVGCMEF